MVRVSDAGVRPRTMQIIHVPEPFSHFDLFLLDFLLFCCLQGPNRELEAKVEGERKAWI